MAGVLTTGGALLVVVCGQLGGCVCDWVMAKVYALAANACGVLWS